MDPIVIERSLAFLDVAAGGDGASVSKAWRSVCGSWALWHDLSQPLRKWRNIAVDAKLHPREFCRLSVADAKRTSLTRDELCSQTWRFRFKRAAGEEWLAVDPYWTDNNPATITFTADGTTERAGTWELEVEVKWRWGHARKARRQPGVAGGESGASVRVVVDGRDVPTLQVARHPVHKGFMMESCWALYTAFPMPAPGQGLDDDDLSVSVEDQVDEVDEWNRRARTVVFAP